ncbi:type VI secretion system tip protein VgrG [Pedobacter gandavensis]|uniref:Type VI secretion system tip protein VgrG n=1 Tax=Pedobacter gandavensis TaxID=2679963 RepID=A0ABR6ET10_9SPHI|nr:type VI secretion system tip protein VgrG [Pedobacter gandavensis]MBB2147959.1 type VI secretion system tip protein VgrG [Pedobacter gandavensis]
MAIKSPADVVDLTLSLVIKVSGSIIPDYYPQISVEIHHQVNRISHAELIFADGTVDTRTFPISDSDSFVPGNEIEILAGYGGEDKVSIFSGVIVKQSIEVNNTDAFSLIVSCKHKAIGMTFNRKDVEFTSLSDADILSKIIKNNQLKAEVTSTSVVQETVIQKGATDWDFILSRAEFYGFLVNCLKGNTIEIAAPKLSTEPVLRLAFGDSILSFNAELDAQMQSPALEASAWDIKTLTILKASATEPSLQAQGNISAKKLSGTLSQTKRNIFTGAPMEKAEIETWANASLLKMRLSALKGSVSFQGNGLVMPGKLVLLEGVGARYSGKAFVSSVSHYLEEGVWKTTVGFGLDDTPIAAQENFNVLPAAGQLPAISGLQIATVKNLFEDPQSLHRIQLTLNSSADNQTGTWARVSNFYATANAGSGFLPEIGDEVVVGFLDSNPRYPVVLGSLYSSSKAPVYPAKDNKNFIKSIITKGNLKISFDDEKKVTKLETPAGNAFSLDDENKKIVITDQHGNVITMDSKGISLASDKDITLKASGDISLNAMGKIELTAKKDAAISGMNVSNKAQVGFTAKGGATAEISSSGQTAVKGGIVMIN